MKRFLVAVLACRNNGTRLFGKPLQNICLNPKITILNHIVSCLKQIDIIDSICISYSEAPGNLIYNDIASKLNLASIEGNDSDVLSRLINGCELVGGTDIFRVTSESPFVAHELIHDAYKAHIENNADATFLDQVIDGCNFEIIKLDALKKSHKDGQERHRSEFCSLYIRENREIFKVQEINPSPEYSRMDLRFTVDNPEDLIVCREVYSDQIELAPMIDIKRAVDFMDSRADLKKLIEKYVDIGYTTMYK